MPELPEVEVVRRGLEAVWVGSFVSEVLAPGGPRFAEASLSAGDRVVSVGRRGKFLLVGLASDRRVVVHLGKGGYPFDGP